MGALTNIQWLERGRSLASNGYILIRVGTDHPLADTRGYAYEHRLIASQKLGRWLTSGEQVHHRDGNLQNNHPDNLEVMPSLAHHRAHHRKRTDLRDPDAPNPFVVCACGCGAIFLKFDATNRPRKYVSGHNPQHIINLRKLQEARRG